MEPLSTYLDFDKAEDNVDKSSIDIEKAKKIYDKIIGLGQGGKMPDIEINSSPVLAELTKISNGVKVVESTIASSNNANKSSYDMLQK